MRRLRLIREQAGAELLEFALVSICLFTFIFGTMEFGRMLWQYNVISAAAKDGVRWAAVRGSTATTTADQNSVNTYVQSRVFGLTGVVVTATWPDGGDKDAGDRVVVKVQTTFTPIVPILPQTARTMSSTAQMTIAR